MNLNGCKIKLTKLKGFNQKNRNIARAIGKRGSIGSSMIPREKLALRLKNNKRIGFHCLRLTQLVHHYNSDQ